MFASCIWQVINCLLISDIRCATPCEFLGWHSGPGRLRARRQYQPLPLPSPLVHAAWSLSSRVAPPTPTFTLHNSSRPPPRQPSINTSQPPPPRSPPRKTSSRWTTRRRSADDHREKNFVLDSVLRMRWLCLVPRRDVVDHRERY